MDELKALKEAQDRAPYYYDESLEEWVQDQLLIHQKDGHKLLLDLEFAIAKIGGEMTRQRHIRDQEE